MNEVDFWLRMERRVTREFSDLGDDHLRHFWCDGFIPEGFEPTANPPRIVGRVWLGVGGGDQESWGFSLIVGPGILVVGQIDWDALLPGDAVTGWLSLDPDRKALRMDPGAAYPDRPSGETSSPPREIDGAEVRWWADVHDLRPTDACTFRRDDRVQDRFDGLAIAAYKGAGNCYLFCCDQHWETRNDTSHETEDDAKAFAERLYPVVRQRWRYMPA